MINPSGNKLEKVVFGIFDQMVEGADKYVTKQGSTWLIFTESKKWVIEFTKDKTLWFNYNAFQNELDLIGKDCTEERDLIKRWFESRFLNKPKVEDTHLAMNNYSEDIVDAIENGVKNTIDEKSTLRYIVEDTIQEGVKDTYHFQTEIPNQVEDTIQNGVKHTRPHYASHGRSIENTIQNGVKEINKSGNMRVKYVEDIIQNGVKQTSHSEYEDLDDVEDTIENGVKHTIDIEFRNKFIIEDTIQNGVKDTAPALAKLDTYVEDTIQNGVKETIGTLRRTKLGVDDIIQNGVKETKSDEGYLTHFTQQYKAEQTIEKGVKETKDHKLDRIISVISTIKNGVKHTKPMDEWVNSERIVDEVVKDGVKEIKTPGEDGDIVGVISFMQDNNTYNVPQLIDDVIENGVKEVKEISNFSLTSEIFKVNAKQAIRDGIKELKVWKSNRCEEHGYFEFVDGIPTYTPMVQVQDVIENGVKEIKELPDKSGELKGYGDYYHRQENWTKPHTDYVKEVIEDSYDHRGRVEGVIRNTDKDGI